MQTATAFAPAHISGFFQPVYHDDVYQTGSRGAGINVDLGVTATVQIQRAQEQSIELFIEEKKSNSKIFLHVIKELFQEMSYHIRVDLHLDLPFSQGFGISAASCLSITYAIASLLHLPIQEAIKTAHKTEIIFKTGLGDVAAEVHGGIEIRKTPGIPPWGEIISIDDSREILVGIIDEEVNTPKILSDKKIQKNIQHFGKRCTDTLLLHPSLEELFHLSKTFTFQTNLASTHVIESIKTIEPYGYCSMCMLGNSVFAMGDIEKLSNALASFGTIRRCSIDHQGARLL